MYRTHTCGELRIEDANVGKEVTLAGWIQRIRDFGLIKFIDLRDRYGITQVVVNYEGNIELALKFNQLNLGREDVIQVRGVVWKRTEANLKLETGQIEVRVYSEDDIVILNSSLVPPFTIEDETDGGDDLRMKYRYLDMRRNPIQKNLLYRHKVAQAVRGYLDAQGFADIETPHLIKTTPEGARDFVVPSRLNPGQFYALPQSPQTFKQLLMVSGFDRYYQIVRCFRDEDLRQDRQPEFTQIDCEMAFVEREDVLKMFEGMVKFVFKKTRGIKLPVFPRMSYDDAVMWYGSDKPDVRFEMKFVYLKYYPEDFVEIVKTVADDPKNFLIWKGTKGEVFKPFEEAEIIIGICAPGCAGYTRKQLDELTTFVKRQQIGADGLIYIKNNLDGSFKSSVDKFFSQRDLKRIAKKFSAKRGDLILILTGGATKMRKALSELRLEIARRIYRPLQIANRKKQFGSEEDIYSIRVDGRRNMRLSNLLKIVKRYNSVEVELIQFKDKISGTVYGEIRGIDRKAIEDIVRYTSNNNERQRLHYFIFVKGLKVFDTCEKIKEEIDNISYPFHRDNYKPLWVLDFPLLEFDEEEKKWNAMHHPFTSWRKEDDALLETDPGKVKANAYDLAMNGVELGGGSIRIHNRKNQERMFAALGMSREEYEKKFGFILNAFEYGTPPHGGIAFGFDRFCSMVIANQEGIRDFMAFPKNNMGRDMMLDAPSEIDERQKKELGLK